MHEIEFPGQTIDNLYFVEEGIGSMTVTFLDGSQVEAGMFGYESVIGISALMGTRRSLNRVYMQLAGRGFTSSIELAREEFGHCSDFQRLALRYVQAQLTQSAQSAACNAKHDIEQRLARWLLICADRAHANNFNLSQEFLADMLGVRRASISGAANLLKDKGLLQYVRGEVFLPDPQQLEKTSCECYRVVKQHLDNYTEFDTGFVV
jgi:CRP-like cAMP-binding protein